MNEPIMPHWATDPFPRVWLYLSPALALTLVFLVSLGVYAVRYARHGHRHDEEIEARGATPMVGMWLRLWFAWAMGPIVRAVQRLGIPASAISTLSVLLAFGAGVALASGRFALGGWLYLTAGICDFLDGRIARSTGEASPRGAALDSVLDRYCDGVVLAGLAWYYRHTWVLLPALVALVGAMLVPYVRARGEGLGVKMKDVGVMQRAERILYLGLAVVLSPILEAILDPSNAKPIHRLAVAGLILLAVSSQLTAATRLVHLLRALDGRKRRPSGRRTLVRNAVAGVLATAADFATVAVLVELAGVMPWLATLNGAVFGSAVNYILNRQWTFLSSGSLRVQVPRYAFVSFSGAVLSAGGVALLLLAGLPYQIAWIITRLGVFLAWNHPLHRDYVFCDLREAR